MSHVHVTLAKNSSDGILTVAVNGREVGSVRMDVPNSNDLLEWLFEVVYCCGVSAGRASLRYQLNDLLQGNSGPGVTVPQRPSRDLSDFKDWPSIKASDIYQQLEQDMKDYADRHSRDWASDGNREADEERAS